MDSTQPQTLQIAVWLQYINAVLALLFVLLGVGLLTLLPLIEGVGAYGIANERRWGYRLAVVASSLYFLVSVATFFTGAGVGLLTLVLSGALVALLLHPMSRSYERIWFH